MTTSTSAQAAPASKKKDHQLPSDNKTHMSGSAKFVVYAILAFFTIVFLGPILFIFINSFKSKFAISSDPFSLPIGETWVGFENFMVGLTKQGFLEATLWSFIITILSVIVIVFFSAMTAYYITRVKTWWTNLLYYLFVVSMIIPFQMVMFPTVKIADMLHLNNPIGIVVLYLGFGSGLSVFMFAGFVKSIPLDVEEAAMIDGCGPLQNYFRVVWPMLKPTAVTVAILNAMWVWNDYLLPYLTLDLNKYKTISVAIQYLKGGYGSVDMGAMMGCLVLAIIPIILFYILCQKYIVKGVMAGAVKG